LRRAKETEIKKEERRAQGWAAGKKRRKIKGTSERKREARETERERERERERETLEEREREEREGRAVDGLDIVSAESSSIKSNYDVIDRGPVGRGRGDVGGGEAKSSE